MPLIKYPLKWCLGNHLEVAYPHQESSKGGLLMVHSEIHPGLVPIHHLHDNLYIHKPPRAPYIVTHPTGTPQVFLYQMSRMAPDTW